MPLVRFAVRNEYKLGLPDLYNHAQQPKPIVDGVAVSGLVGLLRQLGDLAEFAAEVFHGLQEQVAYTASRSRKLVTRVQHVEASLPDLENTILSQTSHMQYACTPGSEWNARINNEISHFLSDDLPHFIMDSYEECREPPRLQMLDRFDTGGPGSCIKRYSDPTFFKRSSASSKVPDGKNSPHEWNARKFKRRRSWKRSKCFSVFTPTVDGSGRLQLSCPTYPGQTSLSYTEPTLNTTFRSDRDQSDSFASEDGKDFIECGSHFNTSIRTDNSETTGLCFGLNEKTGSMTADAIIPSNDDAQDVPKVSFKLDDEDLKPFNAEMVDQFDGLSEQGSTSEFLVDQSYPKTTLDDNIVQLNQMIELINGIDDAQYVVENFEINELNIKPDNVEYVPQVVSYYRGENSSQSVADCNPIDDLSDGKLGTKDHLHTLQPNCYIPEEVEAIHMNDVTQVAARSEGGNAMTEVEENQLNDIESETDHYVDALNTIELESECDFERQTNKTKLLFSSSKELLENRVNEGDPKTIGQHELEYDHDKESPEKLQHSTALVSSHLEFSDHVKLSCNDSAAEKSKKLFETTSSSNEQLIAFTSHLSQEMTVEPYRVSAIDLWTNGIMQGLEPSNPIVNSKSNPEHSDSDSITSGNNIIACDTNHNAMQKLHGSPRVEAVSRKAPECGNFPSWAKLDNINPDDVFISHDKSNVYDHSVMNGESNGDSMPHGTRIPNIADVKKLSAETTCMSEEKPTLFSLLGQQVLRRTGSLGYDDKPKVTNTFTNDSDKRSNIAVPHFPNSPPPSPPMEHMKISFKPLNGFETSQLKLNYPNGVDNHEINVENFPSFQLVPETTNEKHDIGSDSDDTFCQSYACMSDDYLSHVSYSNSEDWESENALESDDDALNHGLQRVSLTASTSSFQSEETAQRNIIVDSRSVGAMHSVSGFSSAVPNMHSNNSYGHQHMKLCRSTEVDSSHFQQPTPHTPPLPPLQWRLSRPSMKVEHHKQDQRSDSLNSSFNATVSGSSISHLSVMDSARLPSTSNESATVSETKKSSEQKLVPQSQKHHIAKGKKADEGGDFLHQIRTKSLNLRRTEPTRITHATSIATSNKVAAILQKANAIRQVVGSDGEDDSWSDT